MKNVFLFLFLTMYTLCQAQSDIVINEIMLSNDGTITDEDGDYSDWIELYNNSSSTINIGNYGISDNVDNPYKWTFPSTNIAPGDHFTFFASGKDRLGGPFLHTNFKLKSDGEFLVLTDDNNNTLDIVSPVSVSTDISYGRTVDGGENFERLHSHSANLSNSNTNSIIFSHNSGFYANSINLTLTSTSGDPIYYTTDGRDPTINSTLYTSPIPLTTILVPDSLSELETSPYWTAPAVDDFKAHIIKSACFSGGQTSSNIYHKTIFIEPDTNARYSDFEILSIITPPENLFDYDTGIYVMGVNYSSSNTVWSGNYFQKGELWERAGHIEYFNTDGKPQFSQGVGLRTHGGKGRNLPQKSLRLYPRSEYGGHKINYPLLDHKTKRVFDKIIVRNSMSCWEKTIIKDEVTAYVCRNLEFDMLDSNPVIVFINGEYWGIQSIREYFDDNYIEEAYDLDKDSINIVLHGSGNITNGQAIDWGTIEGSNDGHIELYDFLNNNDLSIQSNYEYIKTILDIESITDYYCAEIYFNNKDWPTNNNKLWNYGTSGLWRQVIYDLDGGWSYLGNGYDLLSRALSSTGSAQNSPYATLMLRKLIESPEFKNGFIRRMACLMRYQFDAETVVESVNYFKSKYENGIDEHIARWNNPNTVANWNTNVNKLISFANSRKNYVINHFSSKFNINFDPDDYNCLPTFDEEPPNPFPVAMEEFELDHLLIYPNPSNDHKVWLDYSFNAPEIDYQVYDLLGKFLTKGKARHHQQISLDFDSGTYIIRVIYNNKQITKKIILE